jgi:hypothetical protein
MNGINLKDAMTEMRAGNAFSIKFVSYDKKRNTGGIIKSFPEVKLIQKVKKETNASNLNSGEKKANKYANSTRAIKVFVDGMESSTIRKFHIFLLLEFNGKKVYL